MSQYLKESLDSEPYEFTYFKIDNFVSGYEFTDERGHGYKMEIHRHPSYGKYVSVIYIGEKTPSRKTYKRIVGQFKDPLKTLSTFAAIFKDIKENHSSYVKGFVVNIPEKVFSNYSTKVRSVLQRALRNEYSFPIVTPKEGEEKVEDIFHIAMVMRPYKYENIFSVGQNLQLNPKDAKTPDEKADDKLVQSFSDFLNKKNIEEPKKEDETKKDASNSEDEQPEEKSEKEDTDKNDSSDIKLPKKIVPKNDIKESKHLADDHELRNNDRYSSIKDPKSLNISKSILQKLNNNEVKASIFDNKITISNPDYDSMLRILQVNTESFIFLLQGTPVKLFITTDTYKQLDSFIKFGKLSGNTAKSEQIKYDDLDKLLDDSKFISSLKKYNEMTVETNDDHSLIKAINNFGKSHISHFVKNNELNVTFNNPISGTIKVNMVDSGKDEYSDNTFTITLLNVEPKDYFISRNSGKNIESTVENGNIVFKKISRSAANKVLINLFSFYENIGHVKKYDDIYNNVYYVADSGNEKIITIEATPFLLDYFKKYTYTQYVSMDGKYLSFKVEPKDYSNVIDLITRTTTNNSIIPTIIKQVNDNSKVKPFTSIKEHDERAEKYIESVNVALNKISKKDYIDSLKRSIVYAVSEDVLKGNFSSNTKFTLANFDEKSFKELTENSGKDVKVINGIYEVEGLKENVKENSKAEYTKLFPTKLFKILEIYNKYGVATANIYDILDTENSSYFGKNTFNTESAYDSALKKAQSFKHKKLTTDYIYTSITKIDKNDNTYFGEEVKRNSSFTLTLPSVSYTHVSGLNDLKETVLINLKKNDHSNVETFVKNEDGTRSTYRDNEIKGLINNYVNSLTIDESAASNKELYEFIHNLPSKFQPPILSNVPELFTNTFWHTWAATGGTGAHTLAYATLGKFAGNNIGKEYYGANSIIDNPNMAFAALNPNLYTNFHHMYEETQKFYKNKFKAKYAGKTVKLYRGVAGKNIDRYTPATIESWTSVVSTAKAFAKMMSGGDDNGYILEVEVPYSALISTWEVLGQTGDFPREESLKGKKEHMVLGGYLKNAEVKAYDISNPSQIKSVQIFEGFLAEKADNNKEEATPPTILKVVYADDKSFTDPTLDKSIVSGAELEEHTKRKQKTKK
jgi:hypothetical protein